MPVRGVALKREALQFTRKILIPRKGASLKWLSKYNTLADFGDHMHVMRILFLAAVYFAAARFGLGMAAAGQQVTIIWLPSGISVAAIVLFGYRIWPGILLGAFLTALSVPMPVITALSVATGNTMEALVGTALLYRFAGRDHYLMRLRGIMGLLVFTAFIGPIIGATVGATSLCLGGLQPWTLYDSIWLTWWLGDASGIAIVAPFLLAWCTGSYFVPPWRFIIEAIALALISIMACIIIFAPLSIESLLMETRGYPYMIFPLIIWAAMRFGTRGVTAILLLVFGVALWATSHSIDPFFADMPINRTLALLQIALTVYAITGLIIAAAVNERRGDWERMQNMIALALDAVVSTTEDGLIDQWNKQAEIIFGWSREEVIGKPMAELIIPPTYRKSHLQGMERFLKTGSGKILNRRIEMEAVNKQGNIFPVELAISAQKIHGHYYCTGFIRDISERRRSEETKGFLCSLVESTDEAIIGITRDGVISVWNLGAEKLLGYTAAEATGRNIELIVPAEKQGEGLRFLEEVKNGRRAEQVETVRINKNGQRINVLLTISPIFDAKGQVIGASGVLHDITERKETEKNLLRYTNELRRSNQELDDFAYIVSHDLKEPLRGLQSFSQFLLEDYADKLDEEGKKKLHTISCLTQRMESLLETLLYYSRLGRTELAIKETDLNDIVRNVIDLLSITLKEKNVTVEILGKLPALACDRVRIAELFQNLIGNAIKYNDAERNKIEIGMVTDHPRAPGETVIYVRDHGIGIPEKHLNSIFKIFKRLHPRDAYGGGTGSGLAICKKIISQHGGDIWVESRGEGQGATFFFTLPQHHRQG